MITQASTAVLFALLALAGASLAPAPGTPACVSHRCSCVGRRTLSEKRQAALHVFRGRVLSIRDTVVREPAESRYTWSARLVTIEVAARWKGDVSDTTAVWTYTAEGMCAVEFAVGEDWLVFVEEANRRVRFSAANCDGTERVDRAQGTLRALGAPIGARAPNGSW